MIRKGNAIIDAVQVCYTLNKKNKEREIKGLLEALNRFKLKEGMILTYDQEEEFTIERKKINVMPVWKWMLQSP